MSPSSMLSWAGVWLCVTLEPSKWKRTLLWALADILDKYWEKMGPSGASWKQTHNMLCFGPAAKTNTKLMSKRKTEATNFVHRKLLRWISIFALQSHCDVAAAAFISFTSVLCCHDDTLCTKKREEKSFLERSVLKVFKTQQSELFSVIQFYATFALETPWTLFTQKLCKTLSGPEICLDSFQILSNSRPS